MHLPPVVLAGHDDLADLRRVWQTLSAEARGKAILAWVSQGDEDWVHGMGREGQQAWKRALRALGPQAIDALTASKAPLVGPTPAVNAATQERWQRVAQRWGFVRIEATEGASEAWLERLPAMEAAWRTMAQTLGLAEHELGAGRLSLFLDQANKVNHFNRYTQTIYLGDPTSEHGGFTHEWAHALDAHLVQDRPGFKQGWPGRRGLSVEAPEEMFPAPLALPTWESYQAIWAAWGQVWRNWCTILPDAEKQAAKAQWQQADRMHRRGALIDQALRPLHLFLHSQKPSVYTELFQRWFVAPATLPEVPWVWVAEHLDTLQGEPYLATPAECWARAIEATLARRMGPCWAHDRVDRPDLYPTHRTARHWDDHWTARWPAWRESWRTPAPTPQIRTLS